MNIFTPEQEARIREIIRDEQRRHLLRTLPSGSKITPFLEKVKLANLDQSGREA
tara:strand:+ start:62 stop:223 length:162 start_codon:yes stop_codon:yes gene_type:complete